MMKPREINLNSVKTVLTFSHKNTAEKWGHYAWTLLIDNELFNYKTGLGHAKKMNELIPSWSKPKDIECFSLDNSEWVHIPKAMDIVECLFSDAECGLYSFTDFCDNLGYDHDSISALKTYMACQDTETRLRKALGKEYQAIKSQIEERQSA